MNGNDYSSYVDSKSACLVYRWVEKRQIRHLGIFLTESTPEIAMGIDRQIRMNPWIHLRIRDLLVTRDGIDQNVNRRRIISNSGLIISGNRLTIVSKQSAVNQIYMRPSLDYGNI